MNTRQMMIEVLRWTITNTYSNEYGYNAVLKIAEGLHDDFEFLQAFEELVMEFADMYYENHLSEGDAE